MHNVPRPQGVMAWLKLVGCGLLMGMADLVPGVSGGTIAFVFGIYEDFLSSIKTLNISMLRALGRLEFRSALDGVAWQYLLAVVGGMLLSIVCLAKGFSYCLGHELYRSYLYAAFLGLILASAWFCARLIKRWGKATILAFTVGVICSAVLSSGWTFSSADRATFDVYFSEQLYNGNGSPIVSNYDSDRQALLGVTQAQLNAMLSKRVIGRDTVVFSHGNRQFGKAADFGVATSTFGFDVWIFICGMLAISVMLLPGVSGSYLLAVLGVYPIVIGAVAELSDGLRGAGFHWDSITLLLSLGTGILVGAVTFSRLVSYLFNHYHNLTVATLTGFMVGALRTVWPFWSFHYLLQPLRLDKGPQLTVIKPIFPDVSSAEVLVVFGVVAAAFCAVFAIELYATRSQRDAALSRGQEQ